MDLGQGGGGHVMLGFSEITFFQITVLLREWFCGWTFPISK